MMIVHKITRNGVLVEDYDYDAKGRRVAEFNSLRGITGRTATYDDDDRLVTSGDYAYGFDADGFLNVRTNTATLETTTYNYARSGQLNSVTLPDGTVVEYVHNAAGQRIAKKVNGAVTEKYLWAGITGLLAVYDGTDNLVMRFEGAKMVKNGQTYYLVTDQVGTVRAVADTAGNIVKQITYDSFGNILTDSNPTFTIPLGFAGGLHDPDTNLVRFGFRDYDPDSATWTTKDPILFASGDIYLYEYCSSDPINCFDPTGLETFLTRWISTERLAQVANFAAGVGDTMTFDVTSWIRDGLGANVGIDKCGVAYAMGVATEILGESALSGASHYLKKAAARVTKKELKKQVRRATRHIKRGTDEYLHHINTLRGHPAQKGRQSTAALFPTAGLGASIHSAAANLKKVTYDQHMRLHRIAQVEEAILGNTIVNPWLTAARAVKVLL